jgi:hypothetical protein
MNWKGCKWKRSWPNFGHHPEICLGGEEEEKSQPGHPVLEFVFEPKTFGIGRVTVLDRDSELSTMGYARYHWARTGSTV